MPRRQSSCGPPWLAHVPTNYEIFMTTTPSDNAAHADTSAIPRQMIIFGPPGTGKSYKIHGRQNGAYADGSYAAALNIDSSEQIVNAVFHPEYTYGDFMGRLLPASAEDGKVRYAYRSGHFLIALAEAYRRWPDGGNVLLVIDELNRGNAAAIFGSVFNLLDRDDDGWSSYPISLSVMEYEAFLQQLLPGAEKFDIAGAQVRMPNHKFVEIGSQLESIKDKIVEADGAKERLTFKVQLPPNLYFLATINTSDESIYYMDSAFKRRWDWEYMTEDGAILEIATPPQLEWKDFRTKVNQFIKKKGTAIRRLDDKLLGPRFIKGTDRDANKTMLGRDLAKVMFHLWDSVFARDKTPLEAELKNEKLHTFGDFANKAGDFVAAMQKP